MLLTQMLTRRSKSEKPSPEKIFFTFPCLSAYRYSRPFCAAVSPQIKPQGKAAQKPQPPPRRNHKVKIAQQFLQLINAALFCATLTRSIKGRPQSRNKKARLRFYAKSTTKGNHGRHPQSITPNPARRPAGQGQARGLVLTPPLPAFPKSHRYSGVPPIVFSTSTANSYTGLFRPAFFGS
jgi:hypothetical protein